MLHHFTSQNSGNPSRIQQDSSEGSSDSSLEKDEGSDKTHPDSLQDPPGHRGIYILSIISNFPDAEFSVFFFGSDHH